MIDFIFEGGGSMPLRDYNWKARGATLGMRFHLNAHGIGGFDPSENTLTRFLRARGKEFYTLGDIVGASIWEEGKGLTRGMPAWSFAWPVIGVESETPVTGGGGPLVDVLPIFDKKFTPDDRFAPRSDIRDKWGTLAVGETGISIPGIKEDGLEEMLLFRGGAPLVAANNRGISEREPSTFVYDLDPDDPPSTGYSLSDEEKAPLHTHLRVGIPGIKDKYNSFFIGSLFDSSKRFDPVAAWQMGPPTYSLYGHGAMSDLVLVDLKGSGLRLPAIGFSSNRVGGPFFIGEGGEKDEKHYMGENEDGEPCYSTHMDCDTTLWKRKGHGKDFDAPLLFEGLIKKDTPLPYPKPCHLRYDPCMKHPWLSETLEGYWRIQADSEIAGSHDGVGGTPGGPNVFDGEVGDFEGEIGDEIGFPDEDESEAPKRDKKKKDCYDALKERVHTMSLSSSVPKVRKRTLNKSSSFPLLGGKLNKEAYRYTHYPMGFEEILGKPTPSKIGSIDIRDYTLEIPKSVLDSYRELAPVTSRFIFFGGQNQHGRPVYTHRPNSLESRFPGGTGPGGGLWSQPELDITDFRDYAENAKVPSQYSQSKYSKLFVGMAPNASFFWGYPDPLTGEIHEGWDSVWTSGGLDFYIKTGGTRSKMINWSKSLFDFSEANLTAKNLKRGSGSPESSTSGDVGDVYFRTDSSNGNVYFKESGSGNTLWNSVNFHRKKVETISSSTPLGIENEIVLIDCTSGDVTVTLPAHSDIFKNGKSQVFSFTRVENTGGHTARISPSSGNIDGSGGSFAVSYVTPVRIISDGTNYWTI